MLEVQPLSKEPQDIFKSDFKEATCELIRSAVSGRVWQSQTQEAKYVSVESCR